MAERHKASSDLSFTLYYEKKPGAGEDAEPFLRIGENHVVLCVFDGMGGAGSRQYRDGKDVRTGAYLASRTARQAVIYWIDLLISALPFEDFPKLHEQNMEIKEQRSKADDEADDEADDVADDEKTSSNRKPVQRLSGYKKQQDARDLLEQVVRQHFRELESVAGPSRSSRLKSKLIRSFPTTIACLYITYPGEGTLINAIWAGDSRCFLWSPSKGLQQLTNDHTVSDVDPLENLYEDSPISNCINSDNDFFLERKTYKETDEQFVLLSATDGCFGYWPSPMHFEQALVTSLTDSNSMKEWESMLCDKIETVTADDFSLALVAVGYDNFTDLYCSFLDRRAFLYNSLFSPLEETARKLVAKRDELSELELRKSTLESKMSILEQSTSDLETEVSVLEDESQTITRRGWSTYKSTYCAYARKPDN